MAKTQLIRVREKRHLTQSEVCEQLGITTTTLSRWENGHQRPHARLLRELCVVLDASVEELGFAPEGTYKPSASLSSSSHTLISNENVESDQALNASYDAQDLFELGIQFLWLFQQEQGLTNEKMQERIQKEVKRRSVMMSENNSLSRRDFVHMLASTPIALLSLTETEKHVPLTKEVLPYCKAGIDYCWKLAQGDASDFEVAREMIATYIPALTTAVTSNRGSQEVYASLAAQAYLQAGFIAMHFDDLKSREKYCLQAIKYAEISDDVNILAASHRWLACTYYYQKKPEKALPEYMKAQQSLHKITPWLQSGIYVDTSVIQAQLGMTQEALRSLGLARDTFPYDKDDDSNFYYTGHDLSVLHLWSGLVYYSLEDYENAAKMFEQIDHSHFRIPQSDVPMYRYNQAKVALHSNDLEKSCFYLISALENMQSLHNTRDMQEIMDTYAVLKFKWPREKKVRELQEQFGEHKVDIS